MLTFTVEELIQFLSNRTMTFFEGAKHSDDIVFSHYYSFFKRPVLVKEHQVESLYVMVQDRDSSDGKKPSFSRFAKWEFGGFIVDSKTIYLASKTIKELLQNSDFIDDMDIFEKLDSIRIPLFRKNIPADPAMFQDKDTVDKAVRNACSAFLFGTQCNEFSNLIRTMYPLNDDDSYARIGFHLANGIRNQSPASDVLLTLCGWNIDTLLDMTPPIAIEEK